MTLCGDAPAPIFHKMITRSKKRFGIASVYLKKGECYAIMPKVKENALTGGGTHGRIGDGAAV